MTRRCGSPTAGWGAVLLVAYYHGSMIVYLVTPLYGYSEDHFVIHLVAHAYSLACGVVFWLPLPGRNPTRWRPSRRAAVSAVALGDPVNVLEGWWLVAADRTLSGDADLAQSHDVGWALIASGISASALGLGLLVVEHRRLRRPVASMAATP